MATTVRARGGGRALTECLASKDGGVDHTPRSETRYTRGGDTLANRPPTAQGPSGKSEQPGTGYPEGKGFLVERRVVVLVELQALQAHPPQGSARPRAPGKPDPVMKRGGACVRGVNGYGTTDGL